MDTLNKNSLNNKTMGIVLLDGPYISQYSDIGYKMAETALNLGYVVKIFLYMDGVHIPQKDQNPRDLQNVSQNFKDLIKKGAEIKACIRCAAARGYVDQSNYLDGVEITSIYDLAEWMKKDSKIITLGR
ncbi:MAG: DsrE/DsrF/TusD sulfur relay family protein [Methanobacterium formicicum]